MIKYFSVLVVIGACLGFCTFAIAQDKHISRYTTINLGYDVDQDLMKELVQSNLRSQVHYLGDALEQILSDIGYSLSKDLPIDIYTVKISKNQRYLKNLTVEKALHYLIGEPYYLVVDPVNKIIGLKLKAKYKSWVQEE